MLEGLVGEINNSSTIDNSYATGNGGYKHRCRRFGGV